MPQFHYQAVDANRQRSSGQIEAESIAHAIARLDEQGLVVQSIGSGPLPASTGGGENPFAAADRAGLAGVERAAIEEHMARVIERGRDLVPALRAYAKELPASRRREFDQVLQTLERGDAAEATGALATLPGFWIPLLGAATTSRDPGRILREFLSESERAAQLHRQWWLTLAYPLLLAAMAAAVLVALSFFVIPIFAEMFSSFGLRLPWLTWFILSVAEWIRSGKLLVVGVAIVAAWLLLTRLARLLPESVRSWFGDRFGLRFGRATAIARFSQFTADLLEAELAPPQALRLAGMAAGNAPLQRAAWRVARDIESGSAAVQPGNRALTATVLHALQGNLPAPARIRLLRAISECYSERARMRLSWTRGIVEPLAICTIGFVVGVIVLALFMPLISLVQGLS